MRGWWLVVALMSLVIVPAGAADQLPRLAPISSVAPLLDKHCLSCHDQDSLKGGFDLADLLKDKTVDQNLPGWHAVWERLASRDMPPSKHKTRPSEAEYRQVEEWIRNQLETHESFAATQRPRPLRRLNSDEYNRAIQQIFGLRGFTPAAAFPPDDSFDGFTNITEALNLSSVLVEQYIAAGAVIARLAVVDGSQPQSQTRVFTHGDKDWGLAIRGHDPGGAMRKDVWVGDHLFVEFNAPIGTYTVRLKATPRNLTVRPGYVPHFQFRVDGTLVHRTDAAISDNAPMVTEFQLPVHRAGELNLDFRWANGFPFNNNLRAIALQFSGRKESQDFFDTIRIWEFLEQWQQRKDKDPSLVYPFPYFDPPTLEVEGPCFPDGWPQSRLQRENTAAITAQDAKAVATWLLPQLFRRPATASDVAGFLTAVTTAQAALARPDAPSMAPDQRFAEALRMAIQQALVSPHFLFVVEPGPDGRPLTEYELASRLALFLWGTSPDAELMALANVGHLRSQLVTQTRRLLTDPRVDSFIQRFTSEWLGLSRLASIMPEPSLYPRFDVQGLLRGDMADEPIALMGYLLRENRSLFDLLDCDYTFLNDRLADHYHLPSLWSLFPAERAGFAQVSGGMMRKVTLPSDRRGGLVTMAGCLALTSENTRTSPVRRGVWILEKLFNRKPPPPPNVNGVLPDAIEANTAVELLAAHKQAANCLGCHQRIDPLGLALEHFDVMGEYRDKESAWIDPANPTRNAAAIRKKFKIGEWDRLPAFPIDDRFELGGIKGAGEQALKQYLLANKERFARGFSEKLFMYALGRRILITDEPELQRIRDAAMKDNFSFPSVILQLVQSKSFHSR